MAYKTTGAIKEAYGLHAIVVEDNDRNMRHFLVLNERTKTQTVVLCGLLPDSAAQNPNKQLDVFTAFGFDKAADQIDNSLTKFLKKDYAIHIYGHSLGAALAVLFALHLHSGGYKIEKVTCVHFGNSFLIITITHSTGDHIWTTKDCERERNQQLQIFTDCKSYRSHGCSANTLSWLFSCGRRSYSIARFLLLSV